MDLCLDLDLCLCLDLCLDLCLWAGTDRKGGVSLRCASAVCLFVCLSVCLFLLVFVGEKCKKKAGTDREGGVSLRCASAGDSCFYTCPPPLLF